MTVNALIARDRTYKTGSGLTTSYVMSLAGRAPFGSESPRLPPDDVRGHGSRVGGQDVSGWGPLSDHQAH
jgi:hypothetical protein